MMKRILFLASFLGLGLLVQAQQINEVLQRVEKAAKEGQLAQSASYFRQAIGLQIAQSEQFYWTRIDKESAVGRQLLKELADAYKRINNWDKAYLFYRELIRLSPGDVSYLSACADVQVHRGQEKDAAQLYEKVLERDPGHLEANIFLGSYYFLKAELEKKQIEADYKKLSTPTRMQYARYRDKLAQLFSSEYQRAKESLQRVIGRFSSVEAKKALEKISSVEREVNR